MVVIKQQGVTVKEVQGRRKDHLTNRAPLIKEKQILVVARPEEVLVLRIAAKPQQEAAVDRVENRTCHQEAEAQVGHHRLVAALLQVENHQEEHLNPEVPPVKETDKLRLNKNTQG